MSDDVPFLPCYGSTVLVRFVPWHVCEHASLGAYGLCLPVPLLLPPLLYGRAQRPVGHQVEVRQREVGDRRGGGDAAVQPLFDLCPLVGVAAAHSSAIGSERWMTAGTNEPELSTDKAQLVHSSAVVSYAQSLKLANAPCTLQ